MSDFATPTQPEFDFSDIPENLKAILEDPTNTNAGFRDRDPSYMSEKACRCYVCRSTKNLIPNPELKEYYSRYTDEDSYAEPVNADLRKLISDGLADVGLSDYAYAFDTYMAKALLSEWGPKSFYTLPHRYVDAVKSKKHILLHCRNQKEDRDFWVWFFEGSKGEGISEVWDARARICTRCSSKVVKPSWAKFS